MKKTIKILLLIVSAAGLLLSGALLSLFYPLGAVTETVQRYQELWPAVDTVLRVFVAVLCLGFLLAVAVLLFLPSQSDLLTFGRGRSLLQFSRRSLESTVRYCIQDIPDIQVVNVRVKVHRQPEKTKVYVRLVLRDSSRLMNLAETAREEIVSMLQTSLGVAVQRIYIKVTELQSAQSTPVTQPEKAGKERVV